LKKEGCDKPDGAGDHERMLEDGANLMDLLLGDNSKQSDNNASDWDQVVDLVDSFLTEEQDWTDDLSFDNSTGMANGLNATINNALDILWVNGDSHHGEEMDNMGTMEFLSGFYNKSHMEHVLLQQGIQILTSVVADIQQVYFMNITCPVKESGNEPTCQPITASIWPETPEGTWVCRTLKHPVTGENIVQSACIDPRWALRTDTCGCCFGNCPLACTSCPCDLYTTGDARGVYIETNLFDGLITYSSCVSSEVAVAMIAQGNTTTCLEECPDI
jgi:hypothetical protein